VISQGTFNKQYLLFLSAKTTPRGLNKGFSISMERQLSKSGGRQPRKNNNGHNSSVTKSDNKIRSIVKSAIVGMKQLKWFDVYSGTTSVSNVPTFIDVTSIAAGTNISQRVGAEILMRSLRVSGSWVVGDPTNLARLVVFKWFPSNSSDVPSLSELTTATGGNAVIGGWLQYKPSRFQILHDRLFKLDTLSHPIKDFVFTVRINSKLDYDTGSTTGRNHIYLMYVTDSGVTPTPSITYTYQVVFNDLE
jgi:hypothetical protein